MDKIRLKVFFWFNIDVFSFQFSMLKNSFQLNRSWISLSYLQLKMCYVLIFQRVHYWNMFYFMNSLLVLKISYYLCSAGSFQFPVFKLFSQLKDQKGLLNIMYQQQEKTFYNWSNFQFMYTKHIQDVLVPPIHPKCHKQRNFLLPHKKERHFHTDGFWSVGGGKRIVLIASTYQPLQK